MKKKIRIILIAIYILTSVIMLAFDMKFSSDKICFSKNSFLLPMDAFLFNDATIDKEGNLYVINHIPSAVQKFDKNGNFIVSIYVKNDLYKIKNEKDGIHIYAGKFNCVNYHIGKNKITSKAISEQEVDNIESDSKQMIVGNFWISNGKIIILKTRLFPIDPTIIAIIFILMEGGFWIKEHRK